MQRHLGHKIAISVNCVRAMDDYPFQVALFHVGMNITLTPRSWIRTFQHPQELNFIQTVLCIEHTTEADGIKSDRQWGMFNLLNWLQSVYRLSHELTSIGGGVRTGLRRAIPTIIHYVTGSVIPVNRMPAFRVRRNPT